MLVRHIIKRNSKLSKNSIVFENDQQFKTWLINEYGKLNVLTLVYRRTSTLEKYFKTIPHKVINKELMWKTIKILKSDI